MALQLMLRLIVIPKLLRALGVTEIEELYCEPDGNFAHNPEPLPENLHDISKKLEKGSFSIPTKAEISWIDLINIVKGIEVQKSIQKKRFYL